MIMFLTFRGKGNEKSKKAAFRECFFKIGDMRSLLPQGTPVLALTATATSEVISDTMKGLAMKDDTYQIRVSPDRPNIFLYKQKVDKDISKTFAWLIDLLKKEAIETPKTIVYCKSQKDCGLLFKQFKFELGEMAYFPLGGPTVSSNMLIGMFHAKTLKRHKERVSDSLFEEQGVCRVVFASTALGMGVNLQGIRQVIHYGPPRQVDDFVQEIGRAGRDGKPARSLLLFHGLHLKKCEPIMKEYAKTESKCLRKLLLSEFEATSMDSKEAHDCCVVCHSKCKCVGQGCQVDLLKVITEEAPKKLKQKKTRNVDPTQKEELRELLDDYQEELKKWCRGYVLSSESTTGFSNSLTNSVLKTCKYIFSVDDVIDLNPVFSKRHAYDILHMIRDVFEDFEVNEPSDLENKEFCSYDADLEYGGIYEESGSTGEEDSVASDSSELSGVVELD